MPQYFGDPHERCERPQCLSDKECPDDLACINKRCQNPCDCAPSAICNVANHIPSCRCPTGYIGNPHESCTIGMYIFFLIGIFKLFFNAYYSF